MAKKKQTVPYQDRILQQTFTADGSTSSIVVGFIPKSVHEFEIFVAGKRLRKNAINTYDPAAWEIAFKKSDLCKQLVNEYDVVYFDKQHFFEWDTILKYIIMPTPRQMASTTGRTWFSAIPFYYIEWLQEINPEKIYDLGCGWNIFKKYYPNIIGVGAENSDNESFFADIHDFVDDDYILGHQEYFESVFSICALHFIPLSDIRKRALDFASMIKPGGRGWLSLNTARMVERDPEFKDKDTLFIEKYCKKQLATLPSLALLEIDLTVSDEYIDGNIQILFDKGQTK